MNQPEDITFEDILISATQKNSIVEMNELELNVFNFLVTLVDLKQ